LTTTNAFAAPAAGAPLAATTIQRREVGPRDVLIDIAYCGICHTDIHIVRGEWGERSYPLVPGHEIVGVVADVGAEVSRYRVGDTVGVGCMVNSCRECVNCGAGEQQYCVQGVIGTYGDTDLDGTITQGGYASRIVVAEDFVLRIPDGLDQAGAAPLLCAGITMYAPLLRWGTGPGRRVAIVGLGGLGHIGVKLATALGAEVSVLSQTLKKREDGLALGATGYFASTDPTTFSTLAGTFDLIINTVNAQVDVDAYLSLLVAGGTLVCIGIPPAPLSVHTFSLVGGRKTLAGSLFGGISQTQEMLDFCAEHNITADVEVIAADKINEAYERVLASDVRYRFVIDTATLS
jgi:uncharacterized zinc-type alcohol dehydrogenase-like protein